jgi:hypothetical protein
MGHPVVSQSAIATGQLSEREFRQQVLDLCRYMGWRYYFSWTSVHSPAGFPDLVLCHPTRGFLLAELKSETGQLSEAQQSWIDALRAAGVECHVWRPADLDSIVKRLSTGVDNILL